MSNHAVKLPQGRIGKHPRRPCAFAQRCAGGVTVVDGSESGRLAKTEMLRFRADILPCFGGTLFAPPMKKARTMRALFVPNRGWTRFVYAAITAARNGCRAG